MKTKLEDALMKFGAFCDTGKPWYFFLGMWSVLLLANVLMQLFSDEKPKWWTWLLQIGGIINALRDIQLARHHRELNAARTANEV